jgi:hypothetical protein
MICAFTKKDEAIYFKEIDFSTQNSLAQKEWKASKNEKLIFCFSYINHFFWITSNKNASNVLTLYRSDASRITDTLSISLENYFSTETTSSIHYWNHNVSLLLPERVATLLCSSMRGKLYLHQGSLYIVSDENKEYTDISAVNLSSLKIQNYNIPYAASSALIEGLDNHNSFLTDGILLQANIHDGIFTFSITKTKDTAEKKIYNFGKSDEINFRNSPVMQFGSASSSLAEKELTKSRQFIRKVNGSGLALLATMQEGILQAQIGSSVSLGGGGGGGGIYMPGGSMSTPGGNVSMPGQWVSFGSTSGYKYTKTVFFYSIFDSATLSHLPKKEASADKIRQLGDFLDENTRHLKEPLQIDNVIVTGFLNTSSKKFILVRF